MVGSGFTVIVIEPETLGKSFEVAVTVYDSLLLLPEDGTKVAVVAVVELDDVGLVESVQVTPPLLGSLLTVASRVTVSPASTVEGPADVTFTAGCGFDPPPPPFEPPPPHPTAMAVTENKSRDAALGGCCFPLS